jgi:hypothetical protein
MAGPLEQPAIHHDALTEFQLSLVVAQTWIVGIPFQSWISALYYRGLYYPGPISQEANYQESIYQDPIVTQIRLYQPATGVILKK